MEDGLRFQERGVWQKFNPQRVHWNEPSSGGKFSLTAYSSRQAQRAPRRSRPATVQPAEESEARTPAASAQ